LLYHCESVKLDGLAWSAQRRRIDRDRHAVARPPFVVAAQTAVMETKISVPAAGQEIRFGGSQGWRED
jgi:hypothetical protein